MITNKTIKSKYQPKQTNVTWVDLSGETPVEKHFINGKWAEISGGGKGSQQDPGYTVTKSYVTLDEETLTTNPGDGFIVGFQNDFQLIYGDTYIVTYNGVKYKCVADKDYECIWIGGHNGDFSEYPFRIAYFFNEEYTLLFAETQGTYTVKIEHLEETVEITHNFKEAVNTVTSPQGYTEIHPIDILGLPCFKRYGTGDTINDYLSDGYTVVNTGGRAPIYFIVKVTGDNPSVGFDRPSQEYYFTDCEPIQVPNIDSNTMSFNEACFIPIVTYIINIDTEDVNYGVSTYRGFCGFPGYGERESIFILSYSTAAILPINGLLGYQFQAVV